MLRPWQHSVPGPEDARAVFTRDEVNQAVQSAALLVEEHEVGPIAFEEAHEPGSDQGQRPGTAPELGRIGVADALEQTLLERELGDRDATWRPAPDREQASCQPMRGMAAERDRVRAEVFHDMSTREQLPTEPFVQVEAGDARGGENHVAHGVAPSSASRSVDLIDSGIRVSTSDALARAR